MTLRPNDTPQPTGPDERLTALLNRLAQAIESNPSLDSYSPGAPGSASDGNQPQPEVWPAPIPLYEHQDVSAFPLTALPTWLRSWVEAEATETQTPVDMAAMLGLASLATCTARRLRVRARSGWVEPTNLYICVVLPPGNRKSAVFRHAVRPLQIFEQQEAERLQPKAVEARSAVRVAEQQLRMAEQEALQSATSDITAAQQRITECAKKLRALQDNIPVIPRLMSGDITQEALAQLLAQHDECMAVMDSEGVGPIALMLGRYSTDSSRLDLFLRGHPGDSYHCDRLGREPLHLHFPRITLAITCQPEVLRQLTSNREARGLGLLARILFCLPTSTVGQREARPPVMSREVRTKYQQSIHTMLRLPNGSVHGTHLLTLSRTADRLLEHYQNRIELLLGEGRDLGHMTDWASKLAGTCVRVAGLLHAAEHATAPWRLEINEGTVRRAIAICEYLLHHARIAFDVMHSPLEMENAYRLLRWTHRKQLLSFSRRDAFNGLRHYFPTVAAMEPAINMLREHGWIRVQRNTSGGRSRGRPPSPTYDVHPLVYTPEQDTPTGLDSAANQACAPTTA